MTLPDGVVRGQTRLDFTGDVAAQQQQQAALLERMQNGGINMAGLRLHLRAAAPVDPPAASQPTAVMVDTGSGPHLYVFVPGTGWTAMAQTVVPSAHVLATTAGLGSQHTVSGLTAGQVLRASGATAAAFASLPISDTTGTLSVARGGTGQVALTAEAIVIGQGVGPVALLSPGGDGVVVVADGGEWLAAQLLFSDLGGAAAKAQLPAVVAYEDQANVFTLTNRFDGAVTIADGAAATPSLRFTSDPDNGIYLSTGLGADVWSLVAGGAARLRIGAPGPTRPAVDLIGSISGAGPGALRVNPTMTTSAGGQTLRGVLVDPIFGNSGGHAGIAVVGMNFAPQYGSGGTQTFAIAYSLWAGGVTNGTVTLTTWRGLLVSQPVLATGTEFAGVYVESITAATTNYAIYTNDGLVRLGDDLHLITGILDSAGAVDLVFRRDGADGLQLLDDGIALVGESAALARLRLRGFYTASPSDPPQDQMDMIMIDTGAATVVRFRYNDAGTMKVGDVALI